MKRYPFLFRGCALFLVILLLTGCMTTNLPPISLAGPAFEPLPDELELWATAREEEAKLLDQVTLYEDPELEDYLMSVVGELESPGMAANRELRFEVRVVEDPTLNAFAYPHGSLYIHTGLLARLENEDQLATVLGHEMTHVEHRHMVRYQRSIQNKQLAIAAIAVAAEIWLLDKQGDAWSDGHWGKAHRIGILSDLLIGLGLQLAFLASVNGYGRDLEMEADIGGFNRLRLAGYDVGQAPRVYELLADDFGETSRVEVFFFGSHPNLTQRIQNAKGWIASEAPGTPVATKTDRAFLLRLYPVLLEDARLNLNLGRFVLAENQIRRAQELREADPEPWVLLAGLRRAQASNDPAKAPLLLDEARQALEQAVDLDPELPAPHRELGLLAHAAKRFPEACLALSRYLELAPAADDAPHLQNLLQELRRDQLCQ